MVYKLSELYSMSAPELASLSSKDLRKNYQNIKNIVKSRINTFEKHGIKIPGEVGKKGLQSSRGREDAELLQDMKDALAWMRNKRTTLAGYKELQEDFREKMQQSMPDMDFSTPEKMRDFGEFMGEMQDRYDKMWSGISNQARDIYREAVRLNTDPRAMMRNYDYWTKHMKELKAADPIQHRSERQLKPSEYARKLGLEKISGGTRRPGGKRKK